MDRNIKAHLLSMAFITACVLIVFHNYLSLTYTGGWDLLKIRIPTEYLVIKEAVLKYHTLPLWNARIWGGEPFIGISSKPLFYIFYYPALLIPTAAGAMTNRSVRSEWWMVVLISSCRFCAAWLENTGSSTVLMAVARMPCGR